MCDNCMYSEADGEAKDYLIHRQVFVWLELPRKQENPSRFASLNSIKKATIEYLSPPLNELFLVICFIVIQTAIPLSY